MKLESTPTQLPRLAVAAAAPVQPVELHMSAREFFAMAQWTGAPLDLATETATAVLAWLT